MQEYMTLEELCAKVPLKVINQIRKNYEDKTHIIKFVYEYIGEGSLRVTGYDSLGRMYNSFYDLNNTLVKQYDS